MVRNNNSWVCPVYWFWYMCRCIPANPTDPAFGFWGNGEMLLVTYRHVQKQMRAWLDMIGEDSNKFSLHSLRRGRATTVFKADLPALVIKTLDDWASGAYLSYIDVTLDTRMKAWSLFSLQAL